MIDWLARAHPMVRVGWAVIAGALSALAFQPYNLWPLAILGPAGLSLAIIAARRVRGSIGLGFGFGLGMLGVGVNWMQVILFEAMVGLVVVEALFYAVLGGAIKVFSRRRAWPLLVAAGWTATEYAFSHFPFGGFGWMRLGYAMVDSPYASGFPIVGVAGVSFLTALSAQLLAWLALHPSTRRTVVTAVSAVAIFAVSATGLLIKPGTETGTVQAGWVQGGAPGGGVYGLGPARTITSHQLAETTRLAARINAGEVSRPDFVVWPENSTDLDPSTDAQTKQMVLSAVNQLQVPILVGAVVDGPGTDERQTVSLWWDPTGGILSKYVKRGIVPFGEWIPFRSLLLPLIPELKYVGAQSVPGTTPGVLPVTLQDGRSVKLGVVVCYDLAFDDIVHDTVNNGAQVLLVQSSNAMYQGTGQIEQQFAITRARALEARREILVVTTSGISGFIQADGSVTYKVADHQSASGVTELPLREGSTPATLWSGYLELAISLIAVAALVLIVFWDRKAKSQPKTGV